ncbi:hypothetical protein [Oceanicaulis sp.]|uniref:hypothetical protein n=1 Tax=Oceanicaulis sp. TaxID=1924941 RepID=UPI003F723469
MMILKLLALSASAVLLTGCSEASMPAASNTDTDTESAQSAQFDINVSFEPGGFFLPDGGLTAGEWTVHHLFVGHRMEFDAWRESGAAADEIPVWLSLNPMNGETAVNELGQTYYLDSRRIRPGSLTLTDGSFEFRARDETLGEILISGRIQPEYLHTGATPQPDAPALIGGAEIGGDRIRNVSFMHWLGD